MVWVDLAKRPNFTKSTDWNTGRKRPDHVEVRKQRLKKRKNESGINESTQRNDGDFF